MSVSLNLSLRNGKKVKRETNDLGSGEPNNAEKTDTGSTSQNKKNLQETEKAEELSSSASQEQDLDASTSSEEDNFDDTGHSSEFTRLTSQLQSTLPKMTPPVNFNVSHAIKLIPEFDGNAATLTRFLQIAKIHYAKASSDADKSEFLDLIKSKLTGKAYNILLRYTDYDNWEDLETAINKNFTKFRSTQVIQAELFLIKQAPRESVTDYAGKIERLLEELNISSTQGENTEGSKAIRKLNEKTAINNFKRGLRAPLKLIVKSTKHESITSAIEYALEEENIAESENVRTEVPRCNYCKIPGHIANECRKLRNHNNTVMPNKDNRQPFPRFTNQRINTIHSEQRCRYCKNLGHSIQNCRKRQYNNARNNSPSSTIVNSNTNPNSNSNYRTNPNDIQTRTNSRHTSYTNSGNANAPGIHGTVAQARQLN